MLNMFNVHDKSSQQIEFYLCVLFSIHFFFVKYIFDIINFVLRIYEDLWDKVQYISFHLNSSLMSLYNVRTTYSIAYLYIVLLYVFLDSFSPKQILFFFLSFKLHLLGLCIKSKTFTIYSRTLRFKARTGSLYGNWRYARKIIKLIAPFQHEV